MRAFAVLGLVFSTPGQEMGLGKCLRSDLFCVLCRAVCSDLLTLIRQTENDDLTTVLQRFVTEFADDIAPLAIEIATHLVRCVVHRFHCGFTVLLTPGDLMEFRPVSWVIWNCRFGWIEPVRDLRFPVVVPTLEPGSAGLWAPPNCGCPPHKKIICSLYTL